MYIDPEKSYKEKRLINELARLDNLLFGENRDETKGLDFDAKVVDSIDLHKKELEALWEEMRSDSNERQKVIVRLLQGVLATQLVIAALLISGF